MNEDQKDKIYAIFATGQKFQFFLYPSISEKNMQKFWICYFLQRTIHFRISFTFSKNFFAKICKTEFLIFFRNHQNKWMRALLQVLLRKTQFEDRNLRKKIWIHTQILKVSYTIFQGGKNPSCVNAEWENSFWRFFDSITGWPRSILSNDFMLDPKITIFTITRVLS